jgi:hypothetical protein
MWAGRMTADDRCGFRHPASKCSRRPVAGVLLRSPYSFFGICRRHLRILEEQGTTKGLLIYESEPTGSNDERGQNG